MNEYSYLLEQMVNTQRTELEDQLATLQLHHQTDYEVLVLQLEESEQSLKEKEELVKNQQTRLGEKRKKRRQLERKVKESGQKIEELGMFSQQIGQG